MSFGGEQDVTWRPRKNLKLTASVYYERAERHRAWIGKPVIENNALKYVWSHMKMNTLNLTNARRLYGNPTLSNPVFTANLFRRRRLL
jgi:hypothetical protein